MMAVAYQQTVVDLTNLRSIVNERYYPLFGDSRRNIILIGGAGSGKSVFASQKVVIRCMMEPRHRVACFRKIAKTCKVSLFNRFLEVFNQLGVERLWKANKSDLTFLYLPNNSMIHCLGLDDELKLKSFEGMSSAWLEEATEMTPDDYKQINLRIRGMTPGYKQIILTFNPMSAMHWIKEHFFDRTNEVLTTILKTTYLDNRFLPPEDVQVIEDLRETDSYYWDVYGLGEWGMVSGLIYRPALTLNEHPSVFDSDCYGLDFGYNNPMSLHHLGFKDVNPITKKGNVFVREIIHESCLTTPDLIERMIDEKIDEDIPIYCDSEDPSRIKEIQDAGFHALPADKGQGSVAAGIDLCKSLTWFTLEDNVNFNKERGTYMWAKHKDGMILDLPLKLNDHAMDATRYAVFTHLNLPIHHSGLRRDMGI